MRARRRRLIASTSPSRALTEPTPISRVAAADDADVLLLLTEWREFVDADPDVLGKVVAQRNIADGRSVLDADRWRAAGWRYRALGRPVSADSITLTT